MFKVITFLLFFLYLSTGFAEQDYASLGSDGNWKLANTTDTGLKVYSRKIPNSTILAIKVEGVLNSPITNIMQILREVDTHDQWTPDLKKKITIKEISDLEALTFSLNDMPWPLDDRELVLKNRLKLDRKNKLLYILMSSITHPDYPPNKDAVRAHMEYANLGLRPESTNTTYIELTVFADPKGNIPSWVVNFYQVSWPVQFLKEIEKRANKTKRPLKRKGLISMLKSLLSVMDKKVDLAWQ